MLIPERHYTKLPNGNYVLSGEWTIDQLKELIKKEENE